MLPPVVSRGMTNVSYAVGPSNASQEYFSNISARTVAERQAKTNRERGGVIRKRHQGARALRGRVPCRIVDNTVPSTRLPPSPPL